MTKAKAKQRTGMVTVILLMTFLFSPSAFSWDRTGYRVVAKMAQDRLSPKALQAVHDLLGPQTSLLDVATWADEQTEVPGTATWFYVDIPITASSYAPKYCSPNGCLVSKITDFRRILENSRAPKEERQRALKFLIHLITDLHQPLHVGNNGSDWGKKIRVRYYGRDTNLNQVWDSLIIEHYSSREGVWLWEMIGEANFEMKALWSNGTPADWANESLEAAQKAYCLPGETTVMPSGSELGDEYTGRAVPVIRDQLAKAGTRISWILNEIFR